MRFTDEEETILGLFIISTGDRWQNGLMSYELLKMMLESGMKYSIQKSSENKFNIILENVLEYRWYS